MCIRDSTKGYKPNDVKVLHANNMAMWFTRSDIGYGDRHLGIYAYKPYVLKKYRTLQCEYDTFENLEQLRLLSWFTMNVVETKYNGYEINTEADINSWTLQS